MLEEENQTEEIVYAACIRILQLYLKNHHRC